MPRVSIRKILLYALAATSSILLLINIHQTLVVGNSGILGSTGLRAGTGGTGFGYFGWTGPGPGAGVAPSGSAPSGSPPSSSDQKSDNSKSNSSQNNEGKNKQQNNNKVISSDENFSNSSYHPLETFSSRLASPLRPRRFDLSPLPSEDLSIPPPNERPWFMPEGKLTPNGIGFDPVRKRRAAELFPGEVGPGEDRIFDQLMYFPPKGAIPENLASTEIPLKKILLWNGASSWGGARPGRGFFLKEQCPVSSCVITTSRADAGDSDLVIFKDHFTAPGFIRPKKQLWMMYLLECPLHTQNFKQAQLFNWTATYRSDSTIVAPYERWTYFNDNVRQKDQGGRNYAKNKTKNVAWFVSNCGARNGRLDYARELAKYIDVDIYGSCGTKKCPRSSAKACFDMLDKDYKFYLAFENSNCKDYITEKFFVNGLGHDVIPIVMGARPEDYVRSAPLNSFIHVDDFEGPKQLAEYLHKLSSNDEMYNQYFQWKGTGSFINTKFLCRVCALLHDPLATKDEKSLTPVERSNFPERFGNGYSYIKDINEWWRGAGTCINGSWRKVAPAVKENHKENENVKNDEEEEKEPALP